MLYTIDRALPAGTAQNLDELASLLGYPPVMTFEKLLEDPQFTAALDVLVDNAVGRQLEIYRAKAARKKIDWTGGANGEQTV